MPTELDILIGKRLKQLRTEQGYTTTQVADYLEMDQSNYSKIEHGHRRLRKLSQLTKLCTLYDCTEEYILYKSNEHTTQKWKGQNSKLNLNIIAQMNITMKYLKLLRRIQKNEQIKILNDEYVNRMHQYKEQYITNYP